MPRFTPQKLRLMARVFTAAALCLAFLEVAGIWFTLRVPIGDRTDIGVGHGAFGLISGGGNDSRVVFLRTERSDEFYWWFEAGGIMGVGWLVAPLWLPMVIATLAAAWFWWRLAKRGSGSCALCGYDLRSLPPHAVCPECGKPRQ